MTESWACGSVALWLLVHYSDGFDGDVNTCASVAAGGDNDSDQDEDNDNDDHHCTSERHVPFNFDLLTNSRYTPPPFFALPTLLISPQTHVFDNATTLEETYRTLDDLVRCGKIRYVGVSNVSGWQLQKIVQVQKELGLNPIVSLQVSLGIVKAGNLRVSKTFNGFNF